jgi:hypothetical protein
MRSFTRKRKDSFMCSTIIKRSTDLHRPNASSEQSRQNWDSAFTYITHKESRIFNGAQE